MKKLFGVPHASWLYSLIISLVVISLLFSPLAGLGSRSHAQDSGSIVSQTATPTPTPTPVPTPATTPTPTPGNPGGTPQIIPNVPPVISVVQVTNITETSATIVWLTDESADSVVNYGTSTGLGRIISDAGLMTDHSILLNGLEPGVTYYYEVQSTDYSLNTVADNNSGVYYSFTTSKAASTPSEPQPSQPQKIEPLEASALVSPDKDVELKSPSGKITLDIPAGAASENLRVDFLEYTPSGSNDMMIVHLFELNAYAVDRKDAAVSKFDKELQITIKYTPEELAGLDVDSLRLFYLDEKVEQWILVESSKYDKKTMTLTATINHFSIYGDQASPTISGPGRITDAQVSLSSGAATYSYPIEVPPGPGGFQPKVELTYNSGIVNEMKDKRDVGSWVGIGWSLDMGGITWDQKAQRYYLDVNGVSSELCMDTNNCTSYGYSVYGDGSYHTLRESFYKITRVGQTWHVYAPDGTYYQFGNSTNSRRYENFGYFTTYWGWDLDYARDIHGNSYSISYLQDEWNNLIRSSYPQQITYGNVQIQFDIGFNYGPNGKILRDDNPQSYGYNPAPSVVENGWLNSIETRVGGVRVHNYRLWYSTTPTYLYIDPSDPTHWNDMYYAGNHTLEQIVERGADGSSVLSATNLTYTGLQNYFHDTGNPDYQGNPGNPASIWWPYLTNIDNGYGGTVSFSYTQIPGNTANDIWTRQVVTTKTINPGNGALQTYQYTYSGNPQYIVLSCPTLLYGNVTEFRGFSGVRETDASGNYIIHSYFTTGNISSECLTGKEYCTDWYDSSNNLVKRIEYDWSYRYISGVSSCACQGGPYFVYLSAVKETTYTVPSGATKVTQTRYLYDDYGNVITEYRDGDLSTNSDDATVQRVFYPNTSAWIFDKLARERVYATITGDVGGANLKSETLYYYDNLAWGQPPTTGDLTRIEQKKDASTSVSTYYAYDTYGNQLTETDPNNNTTTYAYDTTYHALPVSKQYPTVNSLTMYEYYAWDYGSGKITSDTDVNGNITTYEYDTFKRLTKVIKPYDSSASPTIQYQYNNWGTINQQHLKTLTKLAEGNYTWQSQYFDGVGRVVQTQAQGETGYTVIDSTTTYNTRGLVDKEYVSQVLASGSVNGYYTPAGDWKYTVYAYDALGRVTTQTNADGTTIGHDYSTPWRDQTTDQLGNKTNNYYDAFDRLIKVEILNPSGSIYSTTTYGYDVLNNLKQVVDNSSNTITMNYDWLSRKTSMSDPDMGSWSYTYDNNGNLQTQTDAKNRTITFTYDTLNRLTGKSYVGLTYASYTYDNTAGGNYGKGRRTGMSYVTNWPASDSVAYKYDARGRLIEEKRTIGSVDYTTQYGYNPADWLIAVTYPTGETVTQTYNGRGLAYSLSGSVVGNIVTSTLYNKLGQYTEINLNNGVKTTFGYWGVGGSYDASGGYYGRLWETKSAVGGNTRQDVKYTWDAGGNVASRQDVKFGGTESFTYDFLDRLTAVSGAYTQSYSYNQIGNILTMNGSSYTYGTKPHAVTQVGSTSYSYDANGNMISRGGTTITWNTENLPTAVGTATFVYDADGNRIKKTEGGQTTIYIGKYYEKNISTGNITTYYYLGDRLVALRSGTNLRYVHEDSLGSTSVVTDSSGAQYGYTRYYPYGSTRDSGGSLDTSKKFTGQRLDGTGLYYYGARYYDPVIGRFISADTMVSSAALPNGVRIPALIVSYHIEEYSPNTSGGISQVMDPQELNRFSYALNNPLRYTDPQGNQVDWAEALVQTGIPILVVTGTAILLWYNTQPQIGSSVESVVTGVINTGAEVVNSGVDHTKDIVGDIGNYLFSKHGGQSDKKLRKSIESEANNVKDHEDRLKENPNSQDSKQWRDHAAKAMKNIKDALDDMGPNARQKALDYLREQGIEFNYYGCPKG